MQDRSLQELLLRYLIELLINLLNSTKKVVEWQWMLWLASYYFFFLGFLKEKNGGAGRYISIHYAHHGTVGNVQIINCLHLKCLFVQFIRIYLHAHRGEITFVHL